MLYIFYNKKPLKKSTPLLPPNTILFLCSNNKASQKVVYICSHHFFTYFLLNSFQLIFRLHHYTIMVFSPKPFNLINPRFFFYRDLACFLHKKHWTARSTLFETFSSLGAYIHSSFLVPLSWFICYIISCSFPVVFFGSFS